jgi:hypothetical protein
MQLSQTLRDQNVTNIRLDITLGMAEASVSTCNLSVRDVRLDNIPANIICTSPHPQPFFLGEKRAGFQRPSPEGRGPRVRTEGEGQRYVIYLSVPNLSDHLRNRLASVGWPLVG